MKKILLCMFLLFSFCYPVNAARNFVFKKDEDGNIVVERKESQIDINFRKFEKFTNEYPWLFVNWSEDGRCLIKGNISYTTGEKIYHIPGWKDYATTIIDTDYGEQWFCTEWDAYKAGWRAPYYSGRPSYYPDYHDYEDQ